LPKISRRAKMSAAKGSAALVVHMLADRGELDLDHPVAACWPEFGRGGKEGMPVRPLLDHRAGLEVLTERSSRQGMRSV
jgi:CubicO group peptidase (beta-lactamase class C family)